MTPQEFWQHGLGLWTGVFIGSLLSFWWAWVAALPLVIAVYCYDKSGTGVRRDLAKVVWLPVIVPGLVVCIGLLGDWNLALLMLLPLVESLWVLYHAFAPSHFVKPGASSEKVCTRQDYPGMKERKQ